MASLPKGKDLIARLMLRPSEIPGNSNESKLEYAGIKMGVCKCRHRGNLPIAASISLFKHPSKEQQRALGIEKGSNKTATMGKERARQRESKAKDRSLGVANPVNGKTDYKMRG